MASSMNRVCISGNLTRDPELRSLNSGTSLCKIRVAVNDREKINDQWQDRANYFDVTVWGKRGETVAEHLAKGSQVAIDGRLRWREWEADDGTKRQAVEITAENVVFLGKPKERAGGPAQSDTPADTSDWDQEGQQPAGAATGGGGKDDDIPF